VAGGDSFFYPYKYGNKATDFDQFRARRESVLERFGRHPLLEKKIEPYSRWLGTKCFCHFPYHEIWDSHWVNPSIDGYCTNFEKSKANTYQFLNAGFIMGPAQKMFAVLDCMKNWKAPVKTYDDQGSLTACMLLHPEDVTLDYSGLLTLTMGGLDWSILENGDGGIHNRAFKRIQCFIHFNGHCNKYAAHKKLALLGIGHLVLEGYDWWGKAPQVPIYCNACEITIGIHNSAGIHFTPMYAFVMSWPFLLLLCCCCCAAVGVAKCRSNRHGSSHDKLGEHDRSFID
jgi:hypothetical protein